MERDQNIDMETDADETGSALLSELGLQKVTPLNIPAGMPGPANINIQDLGLQFEEDISIPENIEAPESAQPSAPESAKRKDSSELNSEKDPNEHEDIVVESDPAAMLGCFFTDSETDFDKPPKTPGGESNTEENCNLPESLKVKGDQILIDSLGTNKDGPDELEIKTDSGPTSIPVSDKIRYLDDELGWNESEQSFGTKNHERVGVVLRILLPRLEEVDMRNLIKKTMKTDEIPTNSEAIPMSITQFINEDGNGPFTCLVCYKTYMNYKKFTTHTTPNCPTLNTHGCEVCGQVFVSQRKLKDHMIDHNPTERYTCPTCGKVIKYKYHITEHMKTHMEDRPFACSHCDKAFKFKNHLKRHEALHFGIKEGDGSFPCDFCDKIFRTKACLRRHQFVHGIITDGTNFPCAFCGKGFSCKRDLENHINMHTGERPFPCQKCDKKFTAKKYLLQHNKSVHCGMKRK